MDKIEVPLLRVQILLLQARKEISVPEILCKIGKKRGSFEDQFSLINYAYTINSQFLLKTIRT